MVERVMASEIWLDAVWTAMVAVERGGMACGLECAGVSKLPGKKKQRMI